MTDFRQQRLNMVESQVRPSDITDQRIVRAMLDVARERFVPDGLASLAYIDGSVPVLAPAAGAEERRWLLPPRTLAKLIQLAQIGPQSAVLDVGCATGYSAAVLARLAGRVVALESEPALAREAERRLREAGPGNTLVIAGPLAEGVPAEAPFDAILLQGAVPAVGPQLPQQLGEGGRLVAMVREGPVCRACVWRRSGKTVDRQPAFEGAAERLPGFEVPAEFVL
jgi:protein-L-isoaspartate(D-aspartate) O-methyltransferase